MAIAHRVAHPFRSLGESAENLREVGRDRWARRNFPQRPPARPARPAGATYLDRRPSTITLAAVVAIALLAGTGCSRRDAPAAPTGAGAPLTKVVLQTDWFAEAEHGGFYQALAKGYYREAGLDVKIAQGGPTTRPQEVIATGRADFAIGRSDDVVTYVSRGIPVVIMGAFMQRDPQAIMFHQESGIRSFKDLDGRNIMAVPGSIFIPVMERTFGIKVSVTPSDYGMSRFLADKNFVQQCFVTNEPFYMRREGAKIGVLLLSDTGFSPYRVWYARRDFAAAHPEIVRAFGAASLRGWREYLTDDPAPANALIGSLNPKMDPEFLKFSLGALKEYRLVTGEPAAGESLGQIRRDRLAHELKQLLDINQLDRPVTVDEVLDERFLPDATTAVR